MFDGIAYGKGGSVIGMVERLGHRRRALPSGSSQLPRRPISTPTPPPRISGTPRPQPRTSPSTSVMASFIDQPGVPAPHLRLTPQSAGMPPSTRDASILDSTDSAADGEVRRIPVCVQRLRQLDKPDNCLKTKSGASKSATPIYLRADRRSPLRIPRRSSSSTRTLGINGYYRVVLHRRSAQSHHRLRPSTRLSAIPERMGLPRRSLYAHSCSPARQPGRRVPRPRPLPQSTTPSAEVCHRQRSSAPFATIQAPRIATPEGPHRRISMACIRRRATLPLYTAQGPVQAPATPTSPTTPRSRPAPTLFQRLGVAGDHRNPCKQARDITRPAMPSPPTSPLDAELVDAAVTASPPSTGDQRALYDKHPGGQPRTSTDPGLKIRRPSQVLSSFPVDPILVIRTLDYASSGKPSATRTPGSSFRSFEIRQREDP